MTLVGDVSPGSLTNDRVTKRAAYASADITAPLATTPDFGELTRRPAAGAQQRP